MKEKKILRFSDIKLKVINNLEMIKENLNSCIEEGMIDLKDETYNKLLGLIDEASISTVWIELQEVITKGRNLETEVDVFLANHGKTSVSLSWPVPSR